VPEEGPDAAAVDFLTRLGGAMVAANYPFALVRRTLTLSTQRYRVSHQILLLPNFIQFGGSDQLLGSPVRIVRSESELRYDQKFPLARLVADAENGRISARDGLAELDRIYGLSPRFPAWVNIIGYALVSLSFALLLQPTPVALLMAAGLGLMVGLLEHVGRMNSALGQLLPIVGSFLVAFTAFGLHRLCHFGSDSLRDLLAPLTLLLPGASITLAVTEFTTREVVSGSARLVSGFVRLAEFDLRHPACRADTGCQPDGVECVASQQLRCVGTLGRRAALHARSVAVLRTPRPVPPLAIGHPVAHLCRTSRCQCRIRKLRKRIRGAGSR
jgi:uncharacterized membrane protein YjjP (DUF1212 family)